MPCWVIAGDHLVPSYLSTPQSSFHLHVYTAVFSPVSLSAPQFSVRVSVSTKVLISLASVLGPCVCLHCNSQFCDCLHHSSQSHLSVYIPVLNPVYFLHHSSQPCVCLHHSSWLHFSVYTSVVGSFVCLHYSYQPSVFVCTALLSPTCLSTPHFSALCQSVP